MIKHYELISPLGNHSKRKFGEVYLGKSIINNQLVVIKKIKKSSSKNHINHFLNEAKFSFKNENLPQIIELIETDIEWVLVKNFQEGIPLDEFKKNIPLRDRKKLILTLLNALEDPINKLKNQNITHCDLKPSNFIINQDGDKLKVSIIDFAYAQKKGNNNSKKMIFSLGYSSPELILNQKKFIDHSTDLFSIGCIIYNLLTDEIPFYHNNPTIMTSIQLNHPLFEHKKIDFRTLKILNKVSHNGKFPNKTSINYSSIIENELRKSKLNRYQSINAIIKDLEKSLSKKTNWWKLLQLIKIFPKSKIE